MTHTPGPWILNHTPEFDTFEFDIKAGDYYVAAIPDVPGETEANARLIAAAPELLEAAVFLAGIYRDAIGHGWPELRAAIAKAEGHTS